MIAQKEILFSNSMVEAVNKHLKYRYLFCKDLLNFEEVETFLPQAIANYNHKPHSALYGLTPYEVFKGKISDKHLFSDKIKAASKKRSEEKKKM